MLGLANPVPGPSRGMLFHLALIFVVVVPDAGLKKPYKFFENCMLANIFSFPDGPSRSLIYVGMWKWPSESYKIVMEMFYFQFVGSPTCSLVNIHHYSPPLQCITVKYCATLHYKYIFFFQTQSDLFAEASTTKTNKQEGPTEGWEILH